MMFNNNYPVTIGKSLVRPRTIT